MYSLDRSKQKKPSLLQSYFPRQTSFTTMQQFTTKLHSIPLLDRKTSPLVATFVSRSTSIAGIESLIVFTSNWKPFQSNQGAITHHVAWRSTTKKGFLEAKLESSIVESHLRSRAWTDMMKGGSWPTKQHQSECFIFPRMQSIARKSTYVRCW